MTTILMLFTLYALASPAVEEPLHGYISEHGEQATSITYATAPPSYDQIKPQQTALQGSVVKANRRHASLYSVTREGTVRWRLSLHHKTPMSLDRGDRILTIDGCPFSKRLFRSLTPYDNHTVVIKRKDGKIDEYTDWCRMTAKDL
jgi:hypothetical protein